MSITCGNKLLNPKERVYGHHKMSVKQTQMRDVLSTPGETRPRAAKCQQNGHTQQSQKLKFDLPCASGEATHTHRVLDLESRE